MGCNQMALFQAHFGFLLFFSVCTWRALSVKPRLLTGGLVVVHGMDRFK